MRDQPTGDQLLDTARAVLREDLMAALPADKRHAALMIANAMAIASRQLKNGDEPERQELASLEKMLPLPEAPTAERLSGLRAQLMQANRQLSQWIRDGRVDQCELYDMVREHLLMVTRRKVEESNPKFLEAVG